MLQTGGLLAQMAQKAIANAGKKRFGDFKPEQITYLEINDYIRARLSTPAMTGNRKIALVGMFLKFRFLVSLLLSKNFLIICDTKKSGSRIFLTLWLTTIKTC